MMTQVNYLVFLEISLTPTRNECFLGFNLFYMYPIRYHKL